MSFEVGDLFWDTSTGAQFSILDVHSGLSEPITLAALKSEVLSDLQESPTSANALCTDTDFVSWYNRFAGQYGSRMRLEGLVEYVWPAGQKSVPLSTVSETLLRVNRIENLDSEGNIASVWESGDKGGNGFYIWNDKVYLPEAPSKDMKTRWYIYRKPTRVAKIDEFVDIHAGYEHAVLIPWLTYCAYKKAKRFAIANGYHQEFLYAFRDMVKDRVRQYKPDSERFTVHKDYSPLTG